jgi:poly(A) polymerase
MEGFETYIVGGAVRDLMLGKKPKDFDIASAASPSQIKKIFRNSRIIGRRFRLVHVFFGPKIFEVATFRSIKDGTAGNTFGTIEEDVLRRDFTLNALFYDPEKQLVIDYVGGVEDIRHKRLRMIIPAKTIFRDDPVRMIRAVKYAILAGFPLPLTLRNKIKKEAPLLAGIPPSRLTEEINKVIRSAKVADIIEMLELLGIYRYMQPNAHNLMKTSISFKELYLATLRNLNSVEPEPEVSPDALAKNLSIEIASLSALFSDYVAGMVDWQEDSLAIYTRAFKEARAFVLPMNPQRVHLEKAIRQLLADHGVIIKKTRLLRPDLIDGARNVQPPPNASTKPELSGNKQRRRKHGGKPKP